MTAIAMVSSALIELTQYISARGLSEVDDIISNTVGAIIGYLLWTARKRFVERYIDVC